MKEKFGIDVPANMLYGPNAQLADVIHFLSSHPDSSSTSPPEGPIDWNAEIVLPEDILPQPQSSAPPLPQRVLLTGATGFLGAFLLAELLDQLGDRVQVSFLG